MSKVVTYANNSRQCFCQIQFDSGERVLISIAGSPIPSVKLIRLAFGGLIPRETIWEFNATMVDGTDAYVHAMLRLFPTTQPVHPLDVIRDALLKCSSIKDVRRTMSERQVKQNPA